MFIRVGDSDEKSLPLADRSLSRFVNQKTILWKIFENEGISRAQLAKEIGISKPAVASNVENLIEIGIVEERGEGTAARKGGRKPVMLYINHTQSYVGAVDLSYLEPVCSVADVKHNIVGLQRIEMSKDATPKERRESILNAFLEILDKGNIPLEKLATIIISSPGIFSEKHGAYHTQERHHFWTKIGLNEFLEDRLETEVIIRNDVNLAALGEMHFGHKERIDNMLYVSCGIGLGAGVIIGGELYSGARNAAGEIGYMTLHTGDYAEDYLSIDGLLKRMSEKAGRTVDFKEAVLMVKNGNENAMKIIEETGETFGMLLNNCCVLLDVDTVVLGGDCLEFGAPFLESVNRNLNKSHVYKPKLIRSQLNQIAGIYGCFVLGTERVMDSLVSI